MTYRIHRGGRPFSFFATEPGQGLDIYSLAASQYALRIFDDTSGASVMRLRVTGSSGDVEITGTYSTTTGVRFTAFGAYLGVLAANRLEFPNTGVDIFGSAGSKTVHIDDFVQQMTRANGQSLNIQSLTEVTTIAAAAFTDTTIQFPADSIALGVSVRVTVAIPTAVTFDIGVAGATTRYTPGGGAVSTALGSTGAGVGTTNPSIYAAATSVRITPNAIPAANTGRVRVTMHYINLTAPTS